MTSPPPPYDFARIPQVRARDALWDRKHGPTGPAVSEPRTAELIHPPAPSFWPIVLAGSLLVTFGGVLIGLAPVILGGLATLYAIARFMLEHHRGPDGIELVVPTDRDAVGRSSDGDG